MALTRLAEETPGAGQNASPPQEQHCRLAGPSKKRTRTGCLNCRRKRRKCDEAKPQCEGCQARQETCEWGIKVSWRPENAHTMGPEHPSMLQASNCVRAQQFKIINVTDEVIRDYFEETPNDPINGLPTEVALAQRTSSQQASALHLADGVVLELKALKQTTSDRIQQHEEMLLQQNGVHDTDLDGASMLPLFLSPQYSDSVFEDGIFLPGSQYQELHNALRSRIIDTARLTVPSRLGTPEPERRELQQGHINETVADESRRLAHLTVEQEYVLWQNYIDEVALWLDKFDIYRHFELVLPMLAKHHPHIRYSILALSARQMERKAQTQDSSCSLALYQHAIHLLSPLLQLRTTEVLASCVVLCVLEMMSCSPKAWRRHLDGCAALIQALGLSGGCGGLEQALFWCFARMDICGGLISSERTLIPLHKWMGGGDIISDVSILLNLHGDFSMYANHVVYLTAQVVDLLCSSGKWEQKDRNLAESFSSSDYMAQWTRLFGLLESWYNNRPEEMKALLSFPPPSPNIISAAKPFPTLLYGNGPAVSGNQMYHTAALLMLKYKPIHIQFARKPHSILWHARQICAISISNTHHGCWTNSIQPLYIAGQNMSHPSEHDAIVSLYERIERETGWATSWRVDDLREWWGDLDA